MHLINCALCSFGMSGRVFHGPLLDAHSGFELSAVLERTKNEASKVYPDVKTYRKYEELLENSEIDLIVVNVPDHLHHSFCLQALEAGKHVVVEKPFTLTVKEGQELIEKANKKGLGLFVFQNRRWDSDFLSVKRVIEAGYLGKVVEFEAHYDRFRPDPPKGTWKEDEKLGSGLLYNLGAHLIDQALVLFGWPDAVFADIQKLRLNSAIDDYFTLILYYPGLRAILRSSYLVKKEKAKYIIHGEKGTFIKSGNDPQEERLKIGWSADDPSIGREQESSWGRIYNDSSLIDGTIFRSMRGNYMKFYDNVFVELDGKKGVAVSAEEGLNVIRIIESAIKSNRTGKKIPI